MDIIQIIQDYFTQNPWYVWGFEVTLATVLFVLYVLAIRRDRKALIRAGFIVLASLLFVVNLFIQLPLFNTYYAQIGPQFRRISADFVELGMSACPQDITPVNGVGVAPESLAFEVLD